MTTFHHTTFIINPRSGALGAQSGIAEIIQRLWGGAGGKYNLLVMSQPGDGERYARQEAERGSDLIVAVGGDGTLNEVIRGAADKDVCLGLIPAGSGNGFARYWKLPLIPRLACEALLNAEPVRCDLGIADDHLFAVTFGCGLDAEISSRYTKSRIRGLSAYFFHGSNAYFQYKSQVTTVWANKQKVYKGKPLLLSLANVRGYGGGVVIAPEARADDGYLDFCVINQPPLMSSLMNLGHLFDGKIQQVPGYQHQLVQEVVIERAETGAIHVDGDPYVGGREIRVKVLSNAMQFAIPSSRL